MKRKIGALLAFVLLAGFFLPGFGKAAAANEVRKGEIIFADAGWDSNRFHNAVAGTIAEKVYGYTWSEMAGSTPILHEGLLKGEIDVHMEVWTDNIATYRNDLAEGRLMELGTNFDDDYQGFYVPRYVIEGDKERGIEPMAPDLRTVKDLLKYKDLFSDPENPSKGRIYGAIPGWAVDTIMHNKFVAYGFEQDFIYFRPGSDAALSAALSGAYEKGEPVVGYYWEPTWLMGKYDFVLLEDEPFDPETYEQGLSALPAVNVTIGASNEFGKDTANTEIVEFLSKYRTSSKLTSEALAYMQDTGADYKSAAMWFIDENRELVKNWIGDEGMKKLFGDSAKGQIVFADAGWDSNRFHNAVAGIIAEKVYGYSWTEMAGSTPILHEGLLKGEIDVHMEVWTDNIATYRNDLSGNRLMELGTNFDDDYQGFYVPRYVIEGDKERGIEPMAPDLKTVKDLLSYKELFKDAEDTSKGRIYGAIPGWAIDTIMHNKFLAYGFDKDFIYFRPGSDAALSAALSGAYEKGEPVVGYYWEPTWLMGKYDFVLLEDEPFNPDTYEKGLTALPAVNVTIAASNDFGKDPENKELIGFLSKYRTSSKLTSEALAYMQDTGANYRTAALWFIEENKELVREWIGDDGIAKLEGEEKEEEKKSFFAGFPFRLPLDVDKFDSSVRQFASSTEGFFGAIRNFLNSVISGIEFVLDAIPWFIMLALVFFLGWRSSGSIGKGILYVLLLSFIGAVGLWDMMNETLSIVITSVIVSLALGFPIGILVSTSETVERFVKPVLDTMQTMPVFVYLIPALLFFGLGKAPAVIATTIYAIVPIIRMTTLGINQIDSEILEAAKAYGATYMQALVKVKIPQAMPAIMTGVNQTIMMAVSMVVTTSMIGASGLGMEVLTSVNRIEMGRGLVSGASVVILAVILDRFSQGLARRKGGEKHE
ncbi:glycine betaine ABC transporter substrate-binding protein [Youngiibacter fragilis]|uniref:glycine betaine ABC transporter substrate-binding protein n=1 Tax=Youngiibacter fragilis TaxID=1408819 RepID=UPI0004145D5E|nr:glycine betaine ABC transporter substrate-binding protein [Youngiibacter fragilis]